jgi:hypothetical protein
VGGGKVQGLDAPGFPTHQEGGRDFIFLVPRWVKTKSGWRSAE